MNHPLDDESDRLTAALAERYRVERELGRGGMATVYLAHDLKHDRDVALKVLRSDLGAALGPERFLREITLTARLDHPHILPLLDSGEVAGVLYYVMPYVEGESLRDRLKREKQLPLQDALQIARDVAGALSYAHRLGIVHRDIKPENILLAAAHARVADFGIARAVTAAGGHSLTETGFAIGTPAYMSPEQASGSSDVDGRTDIYSLACVTYEMLAGEPPFTGPTPQSILARKLLEDMPSLRVVRHTVPWEVEAGIAKALAKVPADRYATALQFTEALERGAAAVAPPPRSGVRGQSLWRAGAISLAAAALLGAGWWGVKQLGGGAPLIQSLVVLPLDNNTGDPRQKYFVDGMHEALTSELSKISALKVISRTSAMQYSAVKKPTPQIARELGVTGLIEGSVAREGDRVRITVQLIHGPSDRNLWSQQFDRELRGILELHTEVAQAIAREIKATLTPQEQVRLGVARVVNPKAFEFYLLGRHQLHQRTLGLNNQAVGNFMKALNLDPDYAAAYAGLAEAYLWQAEQGGIPQKEGCSRAEDAIQKALQLDETLAEAHASMGKTKWHCEWNWAEAERAFKRAVELNTGYAPAHQAYGRILGMVGRFDQALRELQRARELDPLSATVKAFIAQVYIYARQYDRAAEQLNAALEFSPDHVLLRHNLGELYLAQGQWAEAVEALERSVKVPGEQSSHYLAMLGIAYARANRRGDAVKILTELQRRSTEDLVSAFDMASFHVALGERERAVAWLEQGYVQRDYWFVELKAWPWLDSLRSDSRYQALMRRMKFPD